MINILYKFVRRLIIPQYPWISKAIWHYKERVGTRYSKYWRLEVIIDGKDFDGISTIDLERLDKDVSSLFTAIGMPVNETFEGIEVFVED